MRNSLGQFIKGNIPWHKETKGIKKSNSGSFNKNSTPWNKGKTKVDFSQLGNGGVKKGYKQTEIHRTKQGNAHSGSKNHFWKGGITKENIKIRNNIKTKLWRKSVFQRDKYLCQMPNCDKSERYLNAHHIKKFSDYLELRFEISNGITLCKKCHDYIKGKEKEFEIYFKNILLKINESI